MRRIMMSLVRGYQRFISPLFRPHCRYYPTCSSYMLQALEIHGVVKGSIMGIARILRCNPFVHGGFDPVPDFFTVFRHPHPEQHEDEIIAAKFHPEKLAKKKNS